MRPLEIILLLAVTILPFFTRTLVSSIRANYLLIFLVVLLALQLIFEGYRWQMIPAYVLVVIAGLRILAMDPKEPNRLSFLKVMGFLVLSLIIIVGWILPAVLPVFDLPEPRGNFSVGSEMVFVETEMDEIITEDPSDKRVLSYKIWYPSDVDVSEMEAEAYIDQASREGFATKYGLPASALNYLDHVKTHAYPDLIPAMGVFPVLIFSHGYGSKATGYYALLTEIASRGYVVVNMNHTYESLGVTEPDGTKKYFDYGYQSKITADQMSTIEPIQEAFRRDLSYQERHEILRDPIKSYFEGRIQDRWAQDIRYTLNLLPQWRQEGLLRGKLDLGRIGVFGHSVGGGTAGNIAMKDRRIKAAVNLDGVQWGEMIDTTYNIPYLYVSADWPPEHEDLNSHIYINKSSDTFYESKLLNSGHPDFMDIPFMIPVPQLAGTGGIDPYEGLKIVTDLVVAFFDKHLKGSITAEPEQVADEYDLLELTIYE